MRARRYLFWLLALAASAAPRGAWAGPNTVDRLFTVDTGKARFVLASAPKGLVLFDSKLDVYRIYRYSPMKGRARVLVVDLDNDGSPEFIGVGKPSFGLDSTGNPVWDYPEGCSELGVGDLLGTPEKEVACIHGRTLSVLAYDGTVLWEAVIRGGKMTGLAVAMLDTDDGKDDLEFLVGKKIWRYKGDGTVLGENFEERKAQPRDEWAEQAEAMKAVMSGQETFDLDGDGTAEESIVVDGAKLVIKSKGKDKPMGEYTFPAGKILSAAVGQLTDDGKPVVALGGDGMVAFVGPDGKAIREVRIDFRKARRKPKVEYVGVNAMGFADRKGPIGLFDEHLPQIAACYAKRHKAYALTRQGKTLFKFDIGPKGKVKGHEIAYSTLNDPKVNGCIVKVVKRWKFPAPTEPGAHVTADLLFTWTDRFE